VTGKLAKIKFRHAKNCSNYSTSSKATNNLTMIRMKLPPAVHKMNLKWSTLKMRISSPRNPNGNAEKLRKASYKTAKK
jgi:hypothetical protein